MKDSSPLVDDLLDAMDRPFVLIDRDYRIVAANAQYCSTHGVDAEGVVGRYCFEVSHHRHSPCHLNGEDCPHHQVFATGETHVVFHTHFDHHGCPEKVRIRGHPIRGAHGELMLGEAIEPITSPAEEAQQDLIGYSPVFLSALDKLSRAASGEAAVLILGESGVGKELAAQFLHGRSPRAARRLVTIDCTTLTEPLFEAELFGHEAGAFTGSLGRRQGLVELASGGTLFLDEVGELTAPMQAKLLRVLESGQFRRLGGRETLSADLRIVAATNQDLEAMVGEGRFREDLYYRLACIVIHLPPLRERPCDILPLAETFLQRLSSAQGKQCRFSPSAVRRLHEYPFPGNIRELRNIVERAVAMCRDGLIEEGDLGIPQRPSGPLPPLTGDAPAGRPLAELEAEQIALLLERHNGHRARVAHVLGISERTLYRKLKRHGLR